MSLGLVFGALVVFALANVTHTAVRAAGYPGYWRDRARAPVPEGAIRLVALGDSSVQAIGADHPMQGYVGRIASHIEAKTGRPVHITNVSTAKKTEGILRDELPLVDLDSADVVIVADTNDLESRVPLDQHRANLTRLADALPADRTVFSDLPPFPGREPYQIVLEEVTDARAIMRADVFAMLNGEGRRLDIFSWLPPHLNSRGYEYWFRAIQPKIDVIIAQLALRSVPTHVRLVDLAGPESRPDAIADNNYQAAQSGRSLRQF
jgi:lysophospholipase L1-like esterase